LCNEPRGAAGERDVRAVRALVTGAAGFIGSTLVADLLAQGIEVVGVDCYTPYYAVEAKRANVSALTCEPGFRLLETDLRTTDLGALLDGIDIVYHLAAQPGVRRSWSEGFAQYVEHNVLATQRLLEAATGSDVRRFVYASSSSVYGNAPAYPTTEDARLLPYSPYGVTKLAGEQLCVAYAHNFGLPTVALRYFTVYGPRQRPDMATYRLVEAAISGGQFRLFGSGAQIRDFTFVGDVVDATARAGLVADVDPGTVLNIAGGSSIAMHDLVRLVEEISGHHLDLVITDEQPGDVMRTGGDVSRARQVLDWSPAVSLEDGIAAQVEWQRHRRLVAA